LPNPSSGATFSQPVWPIGSDRVGRVPKCVKGTLPEIEARFVGRPTASPDLDGSLVTTSEQPQESGDPTSRPIERAEIEVTRRIANTSLTASSALEVYRVALARITPIIGATFASVFLRDERDPGLLRLACAQSWPQSSARFLAELRIREGRGPTGRAVRSGAAVEVVDLFADPTLRDWWPAARELGFVSIISLPLAVDGRVLGAVSFYFRERQELGRRSRALLGVVAHQLATTAERTHVGRRGSSALDLEREIEALRRAVDGRSEQSRVSSSGPGKDPGWR
jgi:GAF domain-containing protein